MPIRPNIHKSAEHTNFADLAQRYHNYWSMDETHLGLDDHMKIRSALGEVLLNTPTDGAVAFCGTGPEITNNKDLDSTLTRVFLTKFPEIIFSDFSQDTLQSTYRSILDVSTQVAAGSQMIIRDYSHGNFSSRFDAVLRNKIESIRTVEDMDRFICMLRDEVTVDTINEQDLPEDYGIIDKRLHSKTDDQLGLQFDKVLKIKQPIRLIVANLLISGMFAVTEMDFRNKLAELQRKYPDEMTDEIFLWCLEQWHQVILVLNSIAGKEFVQDALRANETTDGSIPKIFLSVDDLVTYTGRTGFKRVEMLAIKNVLPNGVTMNEIERTDWDHSHEEIPHTHSVAVNVIE